jgi:hypothetical protein
MYASNNYKLDIMKHDIVTKEMLKEIGNLHMIPPIRKSKLDTKIVI